MFFGGRGSAREANLVPGSNSTGVSKNVLIQAVADEDASGTWKDGLDIAETAANLLEAGELTAMRIPPKWEVEMLRQREVNINALKEHIIKFRNQLNHLKNCQYRIIDF